LAELALAITVTPICAVLVHGARAADAPHHHEPVASPARTREPIR
jgi:hypothetical protein